MSNSKFTDILNAVEKEMKVKSAKWTVNSSVEDTKTINFIIQPIPYGDESIWQPTVAGDMPKAVSALPLSVEGLIPSSAVKPNKKNPPIKTSKSTCSCGNPGCEGVSSPPKPKKTPITKKTPRLVGIVGKAYSGKDTIASVITGTYGGTITSVASPLKVLVSEFFSIGLHKFYDSEHKELTVNVDWEHVLSRIVEYGRMHFSSVTSVIPYGLESFKLTPEDVQRRLLIWYTNMYRSYGNSTVTPRILMQELGSFGRGLSNDFWARIMFNAYGLYWSTGEYKPAMSLLNNVEAAYAGKYIVVSDIRFPEEADVIKKQGGLLLKVVRPDSKDVGVTGHESEHSTDLIPDDDIHTVIENDSSIEDLKMRVVNLFNSLEDNK